MTRRCLLNLLTTVSLVLFVAAVVLWVRSHSQADEWALMRGKRYFLWSQGGRLCAGVETRLTNQGPDALTRLNPAIGPPLVPTPYSDRWTVSAEAAHRSAAIPIAGGATLERAVVVNGEYELYRAQAWAFPHAALAAAVALPAAARGAAWLLAFTRYCHRRSRLRCYHCGYDLRATPGRCPECGRTG